MQKQFPSESSWPCCGENLFFKVTFGKRYLKIRNGFLNDCAVINISVLWLLILKFIQPTLRENVAQKR